MPDQWLAANAKAIVYQMEEYENLDLIVILRYLNSFQHKNYVAFSLLYAQLKEIMNVRSYCANINCFETQK